MNWNDLRIFLAAARCGSLTAASAKLGIHQPTVGRRVDALEKALGFSLFQRHSQGLTLTDEGRRVMLAAEAMEAASRMVGEDGGGQIGGKVNLALPEGIAVHVVAPRLREFLEEFPHLAVSILPSSASADLIHGEADIAVRLFRPTEADLVVSRIGEMGMGLYGSADYFEKRPAEDTPFSRHLFIGYGKRLFHAEENRWLETAAQGAEFPLSSDDTHVRLEAAASGLGLAVLPHFLARSRSLLPLSAEIPGRTVWLVVHRDLRKLPRIRAAMDWLNRLLKKTFPDTDSQTV